MNTEGFNSCLSDSTCVFIKEKNMFFGFVKTSEIISVHLFELNNMSSFYVFISAS